MSGASPPRENNPLTPSFTDAEIPRTSLPITGIPAAKVAIDKKMLYGFY